MLCRSFQPTDNNGLYLVLTDEGWVYFLPNPSKQAIIKSLIGLLPLKLRLQDYGKLIKSGSGEHPPANIIRQMENADFTNQNPAQESQVFFLECHDSQHRHFYTYLDVPYYLHDKFEIIKDNAGEFELTEYGEILHSDWGYPTEEIKQMMQDKYGIKTPKVEHA